MLGLGSWLALSQDRRTHASSVPLPRCRRIAAREQMLPSSSTSGDGQEHSGLAALCPTSAAVGTGEEVPYLALDTS